MDRIFIVSTFHSKNDGLFCSFFSFIELGIWYFLFRWLISSVNFEYEIPSTYNTIPALYRYLLILPRRSSCWRKRLLIGRSQVRSPGHTAIEFFFTEFFNGSSEYVRLWCFPPSESTLNCRSRLSCAFKYTNNYLSFRVQFTIRVSEVRRQMLRAKTDT